MVEETNEFYKSGLHKLYELFQDHEVFADLRRKHTRPGQQPTAQEIVDASGASSTNKPFEGGLEVIRKHLAAEDRPMLVRSGEWDRVQTSGRPLSPTTTASSSDSPLLRPADVAEEWRVERQTVASPEQLDAEDLQLPPSLPTNNFSPSPAGLPPHPKARQVSPAVVALTRSTLGGRDHRPGGHSRASAPTAATISGPKRPTARSAGIPRARPAGSANPSHRNAPYPSPSSLSPQSLPPSARGSFSSAVPVTTSPAADNLTMAPAGPSLEIDTFDFEPLQPTICPADLEIGVSPPRSRQPSLFDAAGGYAGFADFYAATAEGVLAANGGTYAASMAPGSDVFGALSAAGPGGSGLDLSWLGTGPLGLQLLQQQQEDQRWHRRGRSPGT